MPSQRSQLQKDNILYNFINMKMSVSGKFIQRQECRVVFAKGWENSGGCQIEHMVCTEYGIPFVEIYSD